MAVVTELVTKFSYQGSTQPLGEFNAGLGDAIGLLTKVTAGIAAVKTAVDAFVISTLSGADSQQHLARMTGVSIATIQELGFAASQTGSDITAVESTIDSLSQQIGEAAQKGSEEFARLGISVRDAYGNIKTADTILAEVGARFRQLNLSLQEQRSFAEALGIDSSLLQMLNKTNPELARLKERARDFNLVTQEQSEQIIDFNNSIRVVQFGLSALQKQLAIGLSPQIRATAEDFTDFLAANQELIRDGIARVVEITRAVVKSVVRVVRVINDVIQATIGWKAVLGGLAVILGVVLSPIYLVTAGIIAAIAVIDDLIVAFKGGDSVIRDFIQGLTGIDITPVLRALVEGFKTAVGIIKSVLADIREFVAGTFSAIAAIFRGDFSGAFQGLTEAGQAVIDRIKAMFKGVFDFITGGFQKVSGAVKKIGSFIGVGGDDEEAARNRPEQSRQLNSILGATGGKIQNQTVNNDTTINIQTSDPDRAGRAVRDELQVQLDDAETQLNKGGR